jgi:hypothetical protein
MGEEPQREALPESADAASMASQPSTPEYFTVGFDGSEVLGTCCGCGRYTWIRESGLGVYCCDSRLRAEQGAGDR